MANQVVSLAYYVQRAKKAGATCEELSVVDENYHDILMRHVDLAKAAALWTEMYDANDPLIPLSEIDIAQTDYLDIVAQVFNGVHFRDVEPREDPPPTNSHQNGYLDKYILNVQNEKLLDKGHVDEAEQLTRQDILKTWGRIDEILKSSKCNRTYGLVVGRVQSGKTRNYIGMILKAFDEGWNTVIVLTSNNTMLAEQTKVRICGEVIKSGCNFTELDFLSCVPVVNQIAPESRFIGMAQKEGTHLERISKWLKKFSAEQLKRLRVLVIDDESDNATPDTNLRSGVQLSDVDVLEIAETLNDDDVEDPVADWVRGLTNLDLDEQAKSLNIADEEMRSVVTEVAHAVDSRSGLMSMLRHQRSTVVRLVRLDKTLQLKDGQYHRLLDLVCDRFDHNSIRKFRDNNWKTLRDIIIYCFDIKPSRSRINRQICDLFSRHDEMYLYHYEKLVYLGYSATPYANMLNEDMDNNPLAADFIFPMQSSRRYFGLDRIFGAPHKNGDEDCNMPIVRRLDELDEEKKLLDSLRIAYDCSDRYCVEVSNDLTVKVELRSDCVEDNDLVCVDNVEWTNLKNALYWLFCTAAVRRVHRKGMAKTGLADRWTTMLFNISSDTKFHEKQRDWVRQYLESLVDKERRQVFVERCRNVWSVETRKFSRDVFKVKIPDYGTEIEDYPQEWEPVERELNWFLDRVAGDNRVHTIVINCTIEGSKGIAAYRDEEHKYSHDNDDHIWIVCGGNKISRGLTLDGLTVTYFDRARNSTCVDTLEQMGRWFGYRMGYELLPRIWMTGDTIKEFKRMAKIELAMHDELRKNFEAELSPKEKGCYTRVMRYGRRLSGRTRAEKTKMCDFGAFTTFNGCSIRGRATMLGALKALVAKMEPNDGSGQLVRSVEEYKSQDGGGAIGSYHAYPYWRDVAPEKIKDFLGALADVAPNPDVRRGVDALKKEIISCDWDVVIASPKTSNSYEIDVKRGIRVNVGVAAVTKKSDDLLEMAKYTGDNYAFFSGVKTATIVTAEVKMIEKILGSLKNDSDFVCDFDDANRITRRLTKGEVSDYIETVRKSGCRDMLRQDIRQMFGLSRMSSLEYKNKVFEEVVNSCSQLNREYDRPNPILQISLLRPSESKYDNVEDTPFVVVSYYWPGHDDTQYFWATLGEGFEDEVSLNLPSRNIAFCISNILKREQFVDREILRKLAQKDLGLDELVDTKLNEAMADERSTSEPLVSNNSRLGHNVIMYKGWALDPEVVKIGTDHAIMKRLESLACDLIEDGRRTIPCCVIKRAMQRNYPLKRNCVLHDNYGDLFMDMYERNELSMITLGMGSDGAFGWLPICV